MSFDPIAIIGQSCVLPGALRLAELWNLVVESQSQISSVPEGYWGTAKEHVICPSSGNSAQSSSDKTWTDRGGYVTGFDQVFDAEGFLLDAATIRQLDPVFQWVLRGAREAFQDANIIAPIQDLDPERVGFILGNLGYPSKAAFEFASKVWFKNFDEPSLQSMGINKTHPYNRFCFGMPSQLAAQALNIKGMTHSLDAACASSLYAIKFACDQLAAGKADVMLAGAVNHADDLLIHVGFCALKAMSPSGQSRPFHRAADGLVPGEGAGFIVLKRLEDAVKADDKIYGVIRGIGLSNDGRSGGFMMPSKTGQLRAIKQAYTTAGLDPNTISLLECHATGTPVGDPVEVEVYTELFASHKGKVPIGSLKSNLGHLITAAGMAGILKVLAAMKTKVRPPTLHAEDPLAAILNSPLRILTEPEDWTSLNPRRAGISAFGFGGNNSHLILEEWASDAQWVPSRLATGHRLEGHSEEDEIAIVGMNIALGPKRCDVTNLRRYLQEDSQDYRMESVGVSLKGLKYPPNDLKAALSQQVVIFELARELLEQCGSYDPEKTSAFIGIECDPETARHCARWRVPQWMENLKRDGFKLHDDWAEDTCAGLGTAFLAPFVIGAMPNIPANRINAHQDLQGSSCSIGAGELSGIRAMEVATLLLKNHEIDTAIIGAVDLSQESVHETAMNSIEGHGGLRGDAAMVMLLKRRVDAVRDGDEVIAVIENQAPASDCQVTQPSQGSATQEKLKSQFYTSGALLQVAVAAAQAKAEAVESQRKAIAKLSFSDRLGHQVSLSLRIDPRDDQRGELKTKLSSSAELSPLQFPAHPPAFVIDGPLKPVAPLSNTEGLDEFPGPKFDRKQLEWLASDKISTVMGTIFEQQDGYFRQVRMPMPPLLLADRVLGIDAEPGVLSKKGTIWTETDIRADSWYLHHGHMPTGIMIESGQADLLLISWMGVDFANKSERIYRLLGFDLTFHKGLAKIGDTLRYTISIDNQAQLGATRIFFFHYDCLVNGEPSFTVKNGQAGFFSDKELANSAGILWQACAENAPKLGRLDPPRVSCEKRSFNREAIQSFIRGDLAECFGSEFLPTQTHVRTPSIQQGDMLLFEEIAAWDPKGGPWGRGYIKANFEIHPEQWFFKGHFKNDPCMPGTLMLEGCIQTLAFYMTAIGFTLDRDGWRFEPVPEETFHLECRGQVTPSSKELVYEMFIREVIDGEIPTLRADILCTVDGLRAFHGEGVSIRLVKDWPLR